MRNLKKKEMELGIIIGGGTERGSMQYELFSIKPESGQWRWGENRSLQAIDNYNMLLKDLKKDNLEVTSENIDNWYKSYFMDTGEEIDLLRLSENGKPEHYIPPTDKKLLSNLWV